MFGLVYAKVVLPVNISPNVRYARYAARDICQVKCQVTGPDFRYLRKWDMTMTP